MCIVFIIKLFQTNKQLYNTISSCLYELSKYKGYLYLDSQQAIVLPDIYIDKVDKLLTEIAEYPHTIKNFSSSIASVKLLLLIQNDNVIGLLKTFPIYDSPLTLQRVLKKFKISNNYLYISSVIIDKKYRNMGYGKKLFDILFSNINEDMILEVKKDNNAIKLYSKLGFEIIGEYDNEILMKKSI